MTKPKILIADDDQSIASGLAAILEDEGYQVDVAHDGRHVRQLGMGEGFGEIALLSDLPRTATVITAASTTLYRLPRAVFLEAVTGNPHAIQAGEELVRERLAAQSH